jgi:hypothetical protein
MEGVTTAGGSSDSTGPVRESADGHAPANVDCCSGCGSALVRVLVGPGARSRYALARSGTDRSSHTGCGARAAHPDADPDHCSDSDTRAHDTRRARTRRRDCSDDLDDHPERSGPQRLRARTPAACAEASRAAHAHARAHESDARPCPSRRPPERPRRNAGPAGFRDAAHGGGGPRRRRSSPRRRLRARPAGGCARALSRCLRSQLAAAPDHAAAAEGVSR